MDNMNNLMENVRNFFTEQYQGVENSNSFLSFEPMGSMIDPNDFLDENDQISEIKATEQLSILSDRLPQIDSIFLANASRLSSVYEELIESAEFSGSNIDLEDKSSYINKFAEVKGESEFKFNEAKRASISTPEGDYLPVHGFPKKWFDPNSSFWVEKTFSAMDSAEQKPPVKQNPVATKKIIPLMWKTTLMTNPTILKADLAVNLNRTFTVNKNIRSITDAKAAVMKQATPKARRPRRSIKPKAPMAIRARAINDHRSQKVLFHPRKNTTVKATLIAKEAKTEWKNLQVLKHLDFADRVLLTSDIVKNNTAPEVQVRSDGFSMSFEYCIVHLDRQWFNTSMFHYSKIWYCLSLPENYFSTGTKDLENGGVLKSIPTAMILIKNLKIKASWTDDEKLTAKNSVGLGIFNLTDSTFVNNELVSPGMQIIGWMCEVLPKLPRMSDPNMIA